MAKKTQIVVVGGGAGGLELVARLGAKFRRRRHDIILVERNRTHIWKPLLHEVAAGSLDANLDEVGYRSHCYRWGYRFFQGVLQDIDREAGEIVLAPIVEEDGAEIMGAHRLRYDYLVLAVGSVTNDFKTPGAAEHALFLDDRRMADRFRQKLLDHCLRVSRTLSYEPAAEAYVRVAIVGGGATGVELAAELYNAAAALKFYGLEVFDETRLQVTLVEAGPRASSSRRTCAYGRQGSRRPSSCATSAAWRPIAAARSWWARPCRPRGTIASWRSATAAPLSRRADARSRLGRRRRTRWRKPPTATFWR
jgi:NADH dehydrogenase